MNMTLENTLKGINLGEVQTFHNLAVFPILNNEIKPPEYITLGTALKQGVLKVEEISADGSVPEISITNSGEIPVLLLDGEELVGAKQNRVVNMTILLKPLSDTLVNVSCTELGRWSYTTKEFQDSDVVMERSIRARKVRSVSESLKQSGEFRSDQREIWDGIDALCQTAGVRSETQAMRDVYDGKKQALHGAMEAFPGIENQCGLFFLLDGKVLGMDLISRPEAYSGIHDKLVKSYVIDALPRNFEPTRVPPPKAVELFVQQIFDCSEESFPSLGLGTDFRFARGELCGSALIHGDTCIHTAFFSNSPLEDRSMMHGFRQRRGFRQASQD